MNRTVSRRLERLEARAMATTRDPIVFRMLLVHPEKGLTGVLLIDSDQSTTFVPATPEEVERVRADLERRRAARLPGKEDAVDTHDYAPA
jgi:hypothetical protein